jgi:tRNA dimethylallyltransferase
VTIRQNYQGFDPWSLIAPAYHPKKEEILASLKKKRVIVISGPTSVGKSRLALSIAEILDGEIVSADSMQVYRGMDIGTAKPSLEDRELVPHHLVDIREVWQSFSVADFYEEALSATKEILRREKVPIVVGGTGFYLRAFLYGPPLGPASVPEVRRHLQERMESLGCEALYERLQMLDPVYAKTITEHDKHKIIRALEIITISKEPVSSYASLGEKKPLEFDFRCWFLYMPREKLYQKVEKRCEEMVERGFLEEVRRLKEGGIEKNSSASSAIGYRQALEFLQSPQNQEDFEAFLEGFKKASRHYVKRQFTWFKKEPLFRWIDLQELGNEKACEFILQDYEQGR